MKVRLLLALLTACSASIDSPTTTEPTAPEPPPVVEPVAAADVAAVVRANNALQIDLYRRLAVNRREDLVFSSHGLSVTMAMVLAGARGETAQEIARVMRFPSAGADLHRAMGQLLKDLESRPGVRWRTENAAWGQEGLRWEPHYRTTLESSYRAPLHLVDFMNAPAQARDAINADAREKTHGRVAELLPVEAVHPDVRLVVTSTTHFAAEWKQKLYPIEMEFETGRGERRVVPGIAGKDVAARYAENEDGVAFALPYAGGATELVVMLPRALGHIEAWFGESFVSRLLDHLAPELLVVRMPRIEIQGASIDLTEPLEAMGMRLPFTSDADFGATGNQGLKLAWVYQQAYMRIDENGTEAAAATAAGEAFVSAPAGRPVVVNRPFLFFIRDVVTGALLFTGRVVNPR
jgi:serpin B